MERNRWIISDVTKKTGLEAHVLRYWEKELELDIPRNELGHRYYLDSHIEIFKKIHNLKEQGYQLKAIKNVINSGLVTNGNIIAMPVAPAMESDAMEEHKVVTSSTSSSDKMEQFKQILTEVMLEALGEHEKEMGVQISDRVIKQMDYLMRMREELEEDRFKKLDETIRNYQKDRQESAQLLKEGKRKKRFLRKKQKRVIGHA